MPVARLGVVYTPREVCEPMVRRLLAPLIAGRTRAQILALRICDPAIGEGAFALEVVRQLAEASGAPAREVAARCIHGADVDGRALAAARVSIERLAGARVPELRDHLRIGDALALDWPLFDGLVGNPPYIRQEQLGGTKHALRGYAAYDGVADLYVYFLELAARIARRWCLIVPNKWLTAAYGRPLRSLLAGRVEGLVDFGRALPLFRDADAFPCIVWGGEHATAACALRITDGTSVVAALEERGTPQQWSAEPWHVDTREDAALIAQLSHHPTLGSMIGQRWSRGVVTGYNRAFVVDDATRAQLVALDPACGEWIRPLVKGRDIRRWRPSAIDRYVLLVDRGSDPPPAIRAHLARFRRELEPGSGRKPGTYRWYELQDPVVPLAKSRAPRLFYQDIQTQPACCLDATGELVPDTTVWILPSADRFLLALLNSPLYGWFARRRFPPALNGAVRPKLEYMRALPIAVPAPALRAKIERIVDAQLAGADAARDDELARLVLAAYELPASVLARLSG